MWAGGPYINSGREAYIKLILKPGKDPTLASSYRPISLLNLNAKILSRVVANTLAKILPQLIHPVQAGFVRCRSATANIRKVMATLDNAMRNPQEELAIITLDAEKAFDNVSLQWLFQTMESMGFQGEILNFLKIMYRRHACM